MGLYIIAAILLLPLIEIAMFIWVGGMIGVFPTILLTVITALAGTLMLRQRWLSTNEAGAVPATVAGEFPPHHATGAARGAGKAGRTMSIR